MKVSTTQSTFYSCYRNRQSWLHSRAYLRLGKVLLIERVLESKRIDLSKKRILDYGFGAGAFLRHCPQDALLSGVELDPVVVVEVGARLRSSGYRSVDLRVLTPENSDTLPWPAANFDLIVCSHVLEHTNSPPDLVAALARVLKPDGLLVVVVPVNEIASDPKHVQRFTEASLRAACRSDALRAVAYFEDDYWMYWAQPLYMTPGKVAAVGVQALSLAMGLGLCSWGWRAWSLGGKALARLTRAKPAQAALLLEKE